MLGVDGGEQHAAALLPHHLAGGKVDNGYQGLAHQFLRLVVHGDAGEDLAVSPGTVVQDEPEELGALFHALTRLDLHGPEVALAEGVEVHALLGKGLHLHGGEGGPAGLGL